MALNLTTLRVYPEGQSGKQPVFMPSNMQPLTRSLVTSRPATADLFDPGFSPLAPVIGGNVGQPARIVYTVEVPFRAAQANTIPLPLGAIIWLDDPSMNRKLKGRRAISLINEDALIGIRFAFSNAVADGALLAPSGNISFPGDEHVQLYAFTLNPAGGNVSLIQYA
jgi:hypothetical protein